MNSSNPFVKQGRFLPDNVRGEIVDCWLSGNSHGSIGREMNIPRSTVTNVIKKFLERGDQNHLSGGCKTRTARTDDVVMYVEYSKRQQPSISAKEIKERLVQNNVCLPENVPFDSSITRAVRNDLGYSYKRLNVVARESLAENNEERLMDYLTVFLTIDPTTMHFFHECSVIKTTGNRHYGLSAVGSPAIEVQRYASNANYTVNLLHGIFGIEHANILTGPSNGLEVINFFQEAVEVEDMFGNPMLKQGDTVIMDNCGFHHGRHTEPLLQYMLTEVGCNLVFQPPYHPVYNTCEYCFRVLKGWLRKNTKLAKPLYLCRV
ncbi:uncharacterized protein LOC114530785 [Dendronephthya gigantea]|uniref:uncharacterized protein LOC114530785 n=1 Tax=Dendronephthya gigantea TaxID=151771 RepID=UPI00106DC236|nr:uncharacterized protein LOC114530785 [Dendronephthya gigantea]